MIFITHLHLDHLGGSDEASDHTFSLSRGPVKLNPVTGYAPANVSPSKWNPGPKIEVIKEPRILKPFRLVFSDDKNIASLFLFSSHFIPEAK
jgi:glyoxylase-like metal-dependent hydrolase (beta-lactamase superfamily II)